MPRNDGRVRVGIYTLTLLVLVFMTTSLVNSWKVVRTLQHLPTYSKDTEGNATLRMPYRSFDIVIMEDKKMQYTCSNQGRHPAPPGRRYGGCTFIPPTGKSFIVLSWNRLEVVFHELCHAENLNHATCDKGLYDIEYYLTSMVGAKE